MQRNTSMFGDSTLQKVSEKLHMQSKTHADQTKSPLCNDFHTFFPNAWYVENKLLPFSYKRAITFTSFHPSNLIVSFCKLTNKHRVFPMEDYTWIQNCSNCRSLTWSWVLSLGHVHGWAFQPLWPMQEVLIFTLARSASGVFRWVQASRVVELMGG